MSTDHAARLAAAATRLERAHAARDQAIIDARAAGMKGTAIAAAVGLTRQQVGRIVAAERGATIADLARDFDLQPHEVIASLDLGDGNHDDTEIDSLDGWTEAEAREVLTLMAGEADRE